MEEPALDFEGALEELEQIVGTLERGDGPLAEALACYERGIRLLAHCQGLLEGAERTIALLAGIDAEGQPLTAPFDATATAERERPETLGPSRARRTARKDGDEENAPF